MSDPLPQVELEQQMIELVEQGEQIMHAIRQRGEVAAKAKVVLKVAYAKALLGETEGTVPEKEARATLATEGELWESERDEALLVAAKEAGRQNREAQATLRSVNANHRELVTG